MWYANSLLGLQGFKIIFDFSDNSYFSNKELVKTYYMVSDDAEDPVLQRATGTSIQWASGKNPGVKVSLISLFVDIADVCDERFDSIAVLDLLLGLDLHAHTLPHCSWSKADTDAQVHILVQLCTPVQQRTWQLLSRNGTFI